MQNKKIAVYGASGFGREVAWLVEACAAGTSGLEVVCFIDDDSTKQGQHLNGIPVMAFDETKKMHPDASVVSGLGDPAARARLMEKAADAGFAFRTLVHPRVEMSQWIQVGEGTVICAGSILTTNIKLGRHVQINLDCTIGHDVFMDDYATLAPGVHVSGCVHIGKRAYIGTGAVIINGTQDKPLVIGDDVIVGAGSCVTKSITYGVWGGCLPGFYTARRNRQDNDRFSDWRYPEIEEGKPTKYNWIVQNVAGLKLGYKTDIGAFSYINAKYGVTIDDFVQIGSHCSIYSVSTIDNKTGAVTLKKGCRVGSHSVLMPGVTIGENAVVGAFSFVNADVPDGAVAHGIPAKVIRQSPLESDCF